MGRSRNRNRVNATGRNQTSRFARLDFRLLHSNAYRSLSPNARSLLVELASLDNGANNGSLYLSVRDGAHRMGVADLTAASRAFDDLRALGFIELTQDAHFSVKAADGSRARCWRLTWLAGPGRKAPSMAFLKCEPEPQTLARKRMERGLRSLKTYQRAKSSGNLPVLNSGTQVPVAPERPAVPVLVSNTLKGMNGGNLPNPGIRDSATHIAVTMGMGERGGTIGWWRPDCTPQLAALAYSATLAAFQSGMAPASGRA